MDGMVGISGAVMFTSRPGLLTSGPQMIRGGSVLMTLLHAGSTGLLTLMPQGVLDGMFEDAARFTFVHTGGPALLRMVLPITIGAGGAGPTVERIGFAEVAGVPFGQKDPLAVLGEPDGRVLGTGAEATVDFQDLGALRMPLTCGVAIMTFFLT